MGQAVKELNTFFRGPVPALLGAFIAAMVIFWMVVTHQIIKGNLDFLDFSNSFYVAGLLVRSGMLVQLYPSALDPSFHETAFNQFAHAIATTVPANLDFNFMYPPLVAFVFAPLSQFSLRDALLVWQAISLSALAVSAYLAAKLSQIDKPAANLFFISFLSLPLLHVLAFGQVSIVLGVLPLVAGYLLWQRGNNFFAGLVWALLSMKVQLFVPVALIVLASLISTYCRRDAKLDLRISTPAKQLTIGMITGLCLYHGLPTLLLGPSVFFGWLRVIALTIKTIHVPSMPWSYHLTISLPNAILFLTPSNWQEIARLVSKLVSLAGFTLAITALVKISSNKTLVPARQKEIMLIVACLFPPLIAPYLRIYDCTLLLLPTWIIFFRHSLISQFGQTAFKALLYIWIALDIYVVLIFGLGRDNVAIPQILVLAVLIVACLQVTRSAVHNNNQIDVEQESSNSPGT